MCFWDLYHGRKRQTKITQVTAPTGAATPLCQPNSLRVAIRICAPATTLATMATVSSSMNAGGPLPHSIFAVSPTERNHKLWVERDGDIVLQGFNILQADAATMTFTVIETILTEDDMQLGNTPKPGG